MALRVLCADDDEHICLLVSTLLRRLLDAEVQTAHSAPEIFASLENGPCPDLLLLDVMMPGQDGYGVCRTLRADQRFAKLPIVFLTATSEAAADQAYAAGATAIISKPFGLRDFVPRIQVILKDSATGGRS